MRRPAARDISSARKGSGKTTLIQKVCEVLASSRLPADGFYTEEVRQGCRRVGFDVVTLSGNRGELARIGDYFSSKKPVHRVGQYVVDISSFEQLVLPLMDRFVDTSCTRTEPAPEAGAVSCLLQLTLRCNTRNRSLTQDRVPQTKPFPGETRVGVIAQYRRSVCDPCICTYLLCIVCGFPFIHCLSHW
ncbi:cancer-related nucleoside-triphosphatase isoform X5 [Engystomops pustulosus]|uniref:cancer-related nucleoside-triphosphatase isoform X5 n=1 Tax=Engystomops pustulosus TaxID=76066 RepID=UPI003AFA2427